MRYRTIDYIARSAELVHDSLGLIHEFTSDPINPFGYTPLGRAANASLETGMRITRRYEKQDFGITSVTIDGEDFPVRDETVYEMPFCNLLHFKKLGTTSRNKVLLVAPLSGHHATLMKGTVNALLPDHEVYVTDWLDAKSVPLEVGPFNFDMYVSYVIECLNFIGPNTHLMAICQPAVQSLIATAVMAEQKNPCTPRSLVLMAGPLDTSKNPTRVNKTAQNHSMGWFKSFVIMTVPKGYPGAGRKVYPGFMQLGGFISLNLRTHTKKYLEFFKSIYTNDEEDAESFRAFYDEYMAVLDIPAEFYLETIERVFKNNEIGNKTITYQGKPVNFDAITNTALLTVEGAEDDICGIGQTEAAHSLCPNIPDSMRRHHVQEGAGHYGIFTGSKFRKYVRPLITEFIHQYDDK